jgi:hypothetical protein
MSAFDGTWRPDPQHPGPDAPVEELLVADGGYACLTCMPSVRVVADGERHPADGGEAFDELAVTVIDPRTVRRIAWKAGSMVVDAIAVISPFGHTKRETQRLSGMGALAPEFVVTSRRVGRVPAGAHALSGRWQPVEADLPNHEEDTSYGVVDGVLSMRDGFGRAFDAPLDGTPVAYRGDGRFTTVSCRLIDGTTIEEVDRHGDDVLLTTTWRVDPDGRTIHVRFEHADGRVQEQHGRRLD